MIRISNIFFFRFCWKNEKLGWPKCARTLQTFCLNNKIHFSPANANNSANFKTKMV